MPKKTQNKCGGPQEKIKEIRGILRETKKFQMSEISQKDIPNISSTETEQIRCNLGHRFVGCSPHFSDFFSECLIAVIPNVFVPMGTYGSLNSRHQPIKLAHFSCNDQNATVITTTTETHPSPGLKSAVFSSGSLSRGRKGVVRNVTQPWCAPKKPWRAPWRPRAFCWEPIPYSMSLTILVQKYIPLCPIGACFQESMYRTAASSLYVFTQT